eukprot:6822238-Prymnesium_polylepis.1
MSSEGEGTAGGSELTGLGLIQTGDTITLAFDSAQKTLSHPAGAAGTGAASVQVPWGRGRLVLRRQPRRRCYDRRLARATTLAQGAYPLQIA